MKRWNYRVARGHFTQRDYGRIRQNDGFDDLVQEIRETTKENTGVGEELDLEHAIGLLRYEADRLEKLYIRASGDHEEILRKLGVIEPPTEVKEEEVYICPEDDCGETAGNMTKLCLHLNTEHDWDSYDTTALTTDELETRVVEEEVELH